MLNFGNIYNKDYVRIMTFTEKACQIFDEAIRVFFENPDIDRVVDNPYKSPSIEYYLFLKNWIDNVQWQLEDIIRNPEIDPIYALQIKRRIDASNQNRTDLVELIDSYFLDTYKDVKTSDDAKLNTESPAWAVDRLSILKLKIYNMRLASERKEATDSVRQTALEKLKVLETQLQDLTTALDELIDEYASGTKKMKVYKQMKMYNDPDLNPILRGIKTQL